jgi:hypothetical protein
MNEKRWLYVLQQQKKFFSTWGGKATPAKDVLSPDSVILRLLQAVRPHDAAGVPKVRIGSAGDGGYVMLEPGTGGVAYSFGISTYAPWDMQIAERGFHVWQYDASITKTPTVHPNIHFQPYFVVGDENPPPDSKNLRQIIAENGHTEEYDIILQMDIEGAEWEILAKADTEILLHFKQIIVEFHNIQFNESRIEMIEKLAMTHTPVHFHINNHGDIFHYMQTLRLIYQPNVIEVTFARNNDFVFSQCNNYFPTPLDAANVRNKPDVPIGFFDLLLEKRTNEVSKKNRISISPLNPDSPPPLDIPEHLYDSFTMNGEIPVMKAYYDNRVIDKNVCNTRETYEKVFNALDNRTFKYYGDEIRAFYDALDEYPLEGKRVLIWGLAGCNGIQTVIEFGCGDGNQLSLAAYPHYIGYDVSQTAVMLCREKFSHDVTKVFRLSSEYARETAELTLSLDVIYHLVEDTVFADYMQKLFNAATRFVIIYSSNKEHPSPASHVRHRKFTAWVARNQVGWEVKQYIPNRYPAADNSGNDANTSFADFYIFQRKNRDVN